MKPRQHRIAIIGFGPRGLGALEALISNAKSDGLELAVEIFDPINWPAAGPNFSLGESPVCLLNLPVRSIELPAGPLGDNFASFADWLNGDLQDPEAYLPRARLGGYLNARFKALLSNLPSHISVNRHKLRVLSTEPDGVGWKLKTHNREHGPFDDVLLSVGQPETGDDDQISRWRVHADQHELPLLPAYPGSKLIDAAKAWGGKVVAIRGLGLSALDVIRMLTLGLGGRFENGQYFASDREPARIVPFSLDGQAPAPKPANAVLDALFDPTPDETAGFKAALSAALSGPAEASLAKLCDAFEVPTLRILSETGGTAAVAAVHKWLSLEIANPGSQERRSTVDALRANISQAEGLEPPSIGYVIGQVWRKWQPQLRRIYDSAPVPAATAAALIGFDEGLKRYSYGAPVNTSRQLLILLEMELVDAYAADDPDITLAPGGWRLQSGDRTSTAAVMIDSVLPPPALDPVSEPLIVGLREASALVALGEGLGTSVTPQSATLSADRGRVQGLWLTGRLATGSAIASDSIHDCFGVLSENWANAVLASTDRRH